MEINDTYLVVDIETKKVFGHYDKQFYYVDGSSVKSCEEVDEPE